MKRAPFFQNFLHHYNVTPCNFYNASYPLPKLLELDTIYPMTVTHAIAAEWIREQNLVLKTIIALVSFNLLSNIRTIE